MAVKSSEKIKCAFARPAGLQRKISCLAAAFVLCGSITQVVLAEQPPRNFSIAPGALDHVLQRFAIESGIALVLDSRALANLNSSGLSGHYTIEEGFKQLLQNSGYRVVSSDAGYYLVPGSTRPTSGESVRMSTLEVEATGLGSSSLRDEVDQRRLSSVPPVVIVSRDDIEALENKRVSDVAARLPGTYAGGPPGEKKSINLRGVSSDFARFSLDGVDMPTVNTSRSTDLQRISSFMVDEIIYLRSPSAEHEADGISGRLDIRTRVIPEEAEYFIDTSVGGLNSLNGKNRSLNLGYTERVGEQFGVMALLGYDRIHSLKHKDFSELTYQGGGGPARHLGFMIDEWDPKQTDNLNLFLNLTHYHEGGELSFRPVYLRARESSERRRDRYNRVPGTLRDRTISDGVDTVETTGASLSLAHQFDQQTAMDIGLSSHHSRQKQDRSALVLQPADDDWRFGSASAGQSKTRDDQHQLTLNLSRQFGDRVEHEVKAGVLYRNSRLRGSSQDQSIDEVGNRTSVSSNSPDYRTREALGALYLQDTLSFGRLTATPGVRWESTRTDLNTDQSNSVRNTYHDWLPSLPLAYRLNDTMTLRASLAQQINRPKLDELAPGERRRGNRTYLGNADLRPAHSNGADLGLDYVSDGLFLGVNLFERRIKDLIETRETAANYFVYDNVGDGRIRGLEFEQRIPLSLLGLDWLDGFTVTANQAFLSSRVDDPLTGRRNFSDQPEFIGNLGLEYFHAPSRTRAMLAVNRIGKRGSLSYEGDGNFKDKTIYAQTFVDLKVSHELQKGLSLYASADNITNQKRDEYELDIDGVLTRTAVIGTGRTLTLGATWRY